jgi:hypothetical protein
MHASEDIRTVKCLDGLHYSFATLEYIYSDLHPTCCKIIKDHGAVVPALWRCWSFVDLVHRIREIAQALPGLSKKTPELVSFLDATKLAEDYRHYVQHLRGELSKRDVNPFPVWGSLSWVDSEDKSSSHTVFIGAQLKGTGVTSCVYDTLERRWVSLVCLGIAGSSFNFDPIYTVCARFRDFVIPWVLSSYKPGIHVTDKPRIMTVQFRLGKKGGDLQK